MFEIVSTIVVVLLICFALGFYVAVALGLTGMVVGLIFFDRPIWDLFAHIPWNVTSSLTVVVVPLFLLMGEILLRSGVTDEMYETLAKWMNRLPGGLLHTNIGACGLFAAISGSSVATATTIGSVALPAMRAHGYNERLALGSLAAGGTLGILIPPSIILIVYGLLAEASIGQLYIAGVIPGVLMIAAFMGVIFIFAILRPDYAPSEDSSSITWGDRFTSLLSLVPVLILIFLVLGTIYLGIATAVEAAAFGTCGAFLIALVKGKVNRRMLRDTFLSTASSTAMVMFILIGAFLLQAILTFLGLPLAMSKWVVSLGLTQLELILFLCAIYIILGMVMESLAMVVTTLPIIMPMINALGIDLVWFGIIVVILLELSLITPPVGMNLFVLQGVRTRVGDPKAGRRGISDIYMGSLPFVVAMLIVLALVIAFPQLALWLGRQT